ncbi:BnaC09g21190D [Brassica napus]|uniref:BnaC09g21190D protein n=2 Tax=Brassica TaxID=3705 RepID=A0A078FYK0_BRANA|nr:BnaC09g21190D [Brassica napus]
MRSVAIEGLPISDFKKIQALSVTVSFHYESLLSL